MHRPSADIVIIGGGIVGASIAWHLARRGAGRIRILERSATVAAGSTGRATGGFRAQYGTAINVQLSLLALEQLLVFQDTHGVDPEYRPVGYLFMARTHPIMAALRAAQAVQHLAGYPDAEFVSPEEIQRLVPAVDAAGFVGGVFAPRDGYVNPTALLQGLLASAQRLGVEVTMGAPCTALECDGEGPGEGIVAVHTATERIPTGLVINAAGPWAGEVGRLAGVSIPIEPQRRQVAVTVSTAVLPPDTPMTIVADDGFHVRVRPDCLLMARPDARDAPGDFSTAFDPTWLDTIRAHAAQVLPVLRDVPIDTAACWAGLYEMSPDHHLLFGAMPERPNLLLANGSSGHGVMHALAIGQLMAELVVDGRAHTLDMSVLAPDRFARGAAMAGVALL